MQSVQVASIDVCAVSVASGAMVLEAEQLDRPLCETATLRQRRQFRGRRLTAQIYSALYGCSLATAREILALFSGARPSSAVQRQAGRPRSGRGLRIDGGRRALRRRHFATARSGNGTLDRQALHRNELEKAHEILEAVCAVWAMTPASLQERSRRPSIVEPRQAAMATISGLCPALSLAFIGNLLGGRCHTVVLHACRVHERRLQIDMHYAEKLAALRKRLAASSQRPST